MPETSSAANDLLVFCAPSPDTLGKENEIPFAGGNTVVTRSANTLTLTIDVTVSSTYTAAQRIFLLAEDNSSATSGWVNSGAWAP